MAKFLNVLTAKGSGTSVTREGIIIACNIFIEKQDKKLIPRCWLNNSSIWCDFDCASSLIYGNKMPTRCNRVLYCRSYCLLNMFRAPLCPSSGAQEYYTVVAACGISCCGFQVVGLVWSWGLCIRFAGCCSSTPDQQLENHSTKYNRQQPLYNTLELLMMGIVVPETCWASNKICNIKLCCIYLTFYFHILIPRFWLNLWEDRWTTN